VAAAALVVEPGDDLRGVEAHEEADLQVTHPALGDKAAGVTGAAAEVVGELVDGEQLREGIRVGGHVKLLVRDRVTGLHLSAQQSSELSAWCLGRAPVTHRRSSCTGSGRSLALPP